MPPARERLLVVLVLLAAGGAMVLAAAQPFAAARVAGLEDSIAVSGQQVAPALTPLGLVVLALAGALGIAGRIARVVLGAVLLLVGAGVVLLALSSALDPAAGTAAAISGATGVSDPETLVTARSGTGWPIVAVAAGVLAVLLGLVVLVRGRRWSTGGRRFRREAPPVAVTDPISEWDALTRGSDPTVLGDDPGPPARDRPAE